MYAERPAALPGAFAWRSEVPASGLSGRVLPDGCLDLLWADGRLLVAGPDTMAYRPVARAGARFAGLRFAPGAAFAALGVPAVELKDRRVPLDALWPAAVVATLTDQVGSAADPAAALEQIAVGAVRGDGAPDPAVGHIVAAQRAGLSIADTAGRLSLSERQLHRRCLDLFGYGPKMLGRVLRLRRAVALAGRGTAFAQVAAVAGYADQAHLSRDVRALAGVTLGELIRD
ncbi:helix-turn-helix domain-containing protein [Hamadaea tsunoensis]|uniref:helix-turn-helix domain-containing protein n=1 Tax=Hamadaea tsunoensis TaxID=53368 RepID=UPI00040B9905|nr:helix-turn-helix domain-containing protein [Hamadaea tsunoensis]